MHMIYIYIPYTVSYVCYHIYDTSEFTVRARYSKVIIYHVLSSDSLLPLPHPYDEYSASGSTVCIYPTSTGQQYNTRILLSSEDTRAPSLPPLPLSVAARSVQNTLSLAAPLPNSPSVSAAAAPPPPPTTRPLVLFPLLPQLLPAVVPQHVRLAPHR